MEMGQLKLALILFSSVLPFMMLVPQVVHHVFPKFTPVSWPGSPLAQLNEIEDFLTNKKWDKEQNNLLPIVPLGRGMRVQEKPDPPSRRPAWLVDLILPAHAAFRSFASMSPSTSRQVLGRKNDT